MASIKESSREIPVIKKVDLVVVGGGPAGVAAATTASELGVDTLIIEKNGFFGGANVAGYSGTIGGLYSSSVENELEQLVFGFAERFADKLREKGGILDKVPFGHTALSPHDPLVWKETADELVKNAGVDILFHTMFVEPVMEGDCVKGVILENKDGRVAVEADYFIDASGDGDLAAKAGASYKYGKEGDIQAMTMVFRLGNVNWAKARDLKLEDVWKKLEEADKTGKYNLPRKHPFIFPAPIANQAVMNCTAVIAEDGRTLYPTKAEDLTYSELEGRKQIREYERFVKDYVEGFKDAYVLDTATQIGIRQSRSIECKYTLKNDDVVNARKFHTAIVRSAWPIEIHGGVDGVKIVNLDGDYYEIPFEVMIPKDIKGVLVAGRCISAEHEALASARVVAQCFEEGMAAGIAMYLAKEERIEPDAVDPQQLIEMMKERNSKLD
jgi:hypothetical protein